MKTCYYYNAYDCAYTGSGNIIADPNDGTYYCPGNATFSVPSIAPDGKIAIYNKVTQEWELKENHKGEIVYNTTTKAESNIDYYGAIKEGFTLQKPTSIYHKFESNLWVLDESKKDELVLNLSNKINSDTDSKILNDFVYQDKGFYLSLENQFNYKSAYDARNIISYPYSVKGKTEFISFANAIELEVFYLAGFAYISNCIAEGWTAKEALKTKTMSELFTLL